MADHLIAGLHCADVEEQAAAFVLGALEPAEADAVRAHLAACPEPHPEMVELGGVVPALFETIDATQPPTDLGARIRAAAEAEQAASRAPRARPVGAASLPAARRSRGFWSGLFQRPIWAAASIAAALALIALGAWNLQLRDQVAGLSTYRDGVAAVLDRAAQPGAQLAVLGTGSGPVVPSGLAVVAPDGRIAVVMRDLPATSGTQVYEAWLIYGKQPPVPIGGFTVGAGGAGSFTTTHAALGPVETVALTLEPGPNPTTPTLPIVASGTAAARAS